MKPDDDIRRNSHVTRGTDEKYLALAIGEIGEERACLATAYPSLGFAVPVYRGKGPGAKRHCGCAKEAHSA